MVNSLNMETPRTKDMLALLDRLPVEGKKVLMMLPKRDENIVLSTRNIPNAKVQHVSSINVIELLKHDFVIMPAQTVRWIELVFGEGLSADEATQKIASEPETEQVTDAEGTDEATEAAEVPETEESTDGEEE